MTAERRGWAIVWLLITAVYGLTAHWWHITNVDTMGAAWPAWSLVHQHTLFLEHAAHLPDIPWFFRSGGHLVTNRMPGVVLVGVPAQFLLAPFGVSPLAPAILTAVVLTAGAMANVYLLLSRMVTDSRLALAVTAALAFGTGFWTNAGAELWTHGPDAFWLTTALLACQRERFLVAGLALAPAMWTRPHLALAAAAVGLFVAVSRRQLRALLAIGLPTGSAVVGLELYNAWYYGHRSLGGGYAGHEEAAARTSASSLHASLMSAAGSLASPLHGLFVYSPFVVVGALGIAAGWRTSPDWARGSAVGGLLYMAVQWRVNDDFTGGTGLYSYRLPLEMLAAMAPVAVQGYLRLRAARRVRSTARVLVGVSVAIHTLGVFWYQPLGPQGQDLDPWRTWEPWYAAQSRGPAGAAVACIVAAAIVTLALVTLDRWSELRRRANGASFNRQLSSRVSAAAPS